MRFEGVTVDARLWPQAIVLRCGHCVCEMHYDGSSGELMRFLDEHVDCPLATTVTSPRRPADAFRLGDCG